MFKMGCSMAKKILAIDGKNASSSSDGGGGSGGGGGGSGSSSKKAKDKQLAEQAIGGGGSGGGKGKTSGDELGDFSKLQDDPRIPLNIRQIFKITKSWKAIARTMSKTGTAMFLNLFEQNQDLFYLFHRFQHLKGTDLHDSMELREHASTVMATLDQSINSLSDYDNFVTYLHSIGKLHRKVPGFRRDHFWKIEQPFLKAVKQTLDERCNETIEEIYKIAIKLIIETIADGYGDDSPSKLAQEAANKPPNSGGGGSSSGGSHATNNPPSNGGGGGGSRAGGGAGSSMAPSCCFQAGNNKTGAPPKDCLGEARGNKMMSLCETGDECQTNLGAEFGAPLKSELAAALATAGQMDESLLLAGTPGAALVAADNERQHVHLNRDGNVYASERAHIHYAQPASSEIGPPKPELEVALAQVKPPDGPPNKARLEDTLVVLRKLLLLLMTKKGEQDRSMPTTEEQEEVEEEQDYSLKFGRKSRRQLEIIGMEKNKKVKQKGSAWQQSIGGCGEPQTRQQRRIWNSKLPTWRRYNRRCGGPERVEISSGSGRVRQPPASRVPANPARRLGEAATSASNVVVAAAAAATAAVGDGSGADLNGLGQLKLNKTAEGGSSRCSHNELAGGHAEAGGCSTDAARCKAASACRARAVQGNGGTINCTNEAFVRSRQCPLGDLLPAADNTAGRGGINLKFKHESVVVVEQNGFKQRILDGQERKEEEEEEQVEEQESGNGEGCGQRQIYLAEIDGPRQICHDRMGKCGAASCEPVVGTISPTPLTSHVGLKATIPEARQGPANRDKFGPCWPACSRLSAASTSAKLEMPGRHHGRCIKARSSPFRGSLTAHNGTLNEDFDNNGNQANKAPTEDNDDGNGESQIKQSSLEPSGNEQIHRVQCSGALKRNNHLHHHHHQLVNTCHQPVWQAPSSRVAAVAFRKAGCQFSSLFAMNNIKRIRMRRRIRRKLGSHDGDQNDSGSCFRGRQEAANTICSPLTPILANINSSGKGSGSSSSSSSISNGSGSGGGSGSGSGDGSKTSNLKLSKASRHKFNLTSDLDDLTELIKMLMLTVASHANTKGAAYNLTANAAMLNPTDANTNTADTFAMLAAD